MFACLLPAYLSVLLQHYFAKAFNPTKNTIVDTIRIVVEDMKVCNSSPVIERLGMLQHLK